MSDSDNLDKWLGGTFSVRPAAEDRYEPQAGMAFHPLATKTASNYVDTFEQKLNERAVEMARSQDMTEVQQVQVKEAYDSIGPDSRTLKRHREFAKAVVAVILTTIVSLGLGQLGLEVSQKAAVAWLVVLSVLMLPLGAYAYKDLF